MPKPEVIEDGYGQEITVELEFGQGIDVVFDVVLAVTREGDPHPASSRVRQRDTRYSPLTPDQARKLAKQLEKAAEEAER